MGDEILMLLMLLDLRGDLRAEKMEDVLDWVFSEPRSRSRVAGLFLGFFKIPFGGAAAAESCFE